ncbi:hypothetical protein SEA_OTTAWA_86 [Arthrobacter phage Ottawa]|nr:hypothetical protein SEA_KHARCHO_86 [Arthrobacter phage Kharcho]WIC89318.1 hypothetical protein SEA_OTTAWA_86 [Arthrobacter phage Ottawa]
MAQIGPLSSYTAEQKEGYAAQRAGKRFTANPYPYATAQRESEHWARGYSASRTDTIRERRNQQ